MIGTYIFIFIVVVLIASGLFTVKQQTIAIIERFGKFQSTRNSGLQLKIPLVDKVSGRVSLRVQQLDVIVETKTKDDVFVHLKISVQFLNNELRSDSIKITAHKKICDNANQCSNSVVDQNFANSIKENIITSARSLKIEEAKKGKK